MAFHHFLSTEFTTAMVTINSEVDVAFCNVF